MGYLILNTAATEITILTVNNIMIKRLQLNPVIDWTLIASIVAFTSVCLVSVVGQVIETSYNQEQIRTETARKNKEMEVRNNCSFIAAAYKKDFAECLREAGLE